MSRTPVRAPSSEPVEAPSSDTSSPLEDSEILQALAAPRHEVPRPRQVFVNRNLRMDSIEWVGFDMDYTLAVYHEERIERLSFEMTVARMIRERGYPKELTQIAYDPWFVMRGLVVDKDLGNLVKFDRYGHVGRAYHGRRRLNRGELRVYRDVKVNLSSDRFEWIDSLFALPEACLYTDVIELYEREGRRVDYAKLYIDIRECIDAVHRDGSLKAVIGTDIPHYVVVDADLGPALHKLRSGGKKLFILTNSLWDYTNAVMKALLDGRLQDYASWRNYFDLVVCGAHKPSFFSSRDPFLVVDPSDGRALGEADALERGRVYQGGNLVDFERKVGHAGERLLYVGDHIYGDILRSKKTSLWRTCMILPELEDEIAYLDQHRAERAELARLDQLRVQLDDEINSRKIELAALDRRFERENQSGKRQHAEKRRAGKALLEKLRRAAKAASEEADALEERLEQGYNPAWGLLFKQGTENSRFGQQVEQYACIYTSRASNLVFYSPMQYFRSCRDAMPHERVEGLVGGLLRNGASRRDC